VKLDNNNKYISMKIEQNKVVSIHYTLKDEDGKVMDSTRDRKEVLAYLHGAGSLVVGLENDLEGKEKGHASSLSIAPKLAFGDYDEKNVQVVPLEGFKSEGEEVLVAGMQVQVESNEGPKMAVVKDITGEDVTLDLNHPLAGATLNFDVEVMDVREATKEEIAHGHAHGEGGHHH
jgi:FKBP-type peptidyl-prolyl cis-trans isomerase SlyD